MHILSTRNVAGRLPAASEAPAGEGFPGDKELAPGTGVSYFPPSRSLAMVANCMLDVPS
jgi:hypothetical protein